MKRKLALSIIAIIISMGLIACGSNNSDSTAQTETTAQEEPESENTEEEATPAEVSEESSPEPVKDEPEVIEEEADVPYWYMDSEGIKNEELGIVIKRENLNLEGERCYFSILFLTRVSSDGETSSLTNAAMKCSYYENDLDTYISHGSTWFSITYDGIKKNKIGDTEYACGENSAFIGVAIVGNGVAVHLELPKKMDSIDDWLNERVKFENESNIDSLAYVADDGLHIPALGINILIDEETDEDESINVGGETKEGVSLSISNAFGRIYGTASTQIQIDDYLQRLTFTDFSAFEDIVEIDLGKYKYIGKGGAGNENIVWVFASNETDYYISFRVAHNDQYEASEYEDFISLIENLE